jgi:outer membrane lipoprotein-sorting protein
VPATAQPRDVNAILDAVEREQRSASVEYVGDITVASRGGAERHKTWISFRQGNGKTANRLIRFLSPAELRGVAYLSLGRSGGSPEQWMYLPSMKRERRLAPQDRDAPFAGTDFTYADLDEFDRSDYVASLESDQIIDGESCYTVRLVPRRPSASTYESMAISQSRFVPRRIQYFRGGRSTPVKTLSFSNDAQFGGRWVAQRMEMSDESTGSRTVVLLTDVRFDRPQPPDRFTLQNLTREAADMPSTSNGGRPPAVKNSLGWFRPAASPAAPFNTPWPGLSGALDAGVMLYPKGRRAVDDLAIGLARIDLRQQIGHGRVRFDAAVRAEEGTGGQLGSVSWDPADRLPRQSPLSLREVSLSTTLARALDFTVGRFEVGWGSTDTHSPAAGFLPRDLTDPLALENLPLWGARLTGERGVVRVDVYHEFTTTPWRLPRLDGRYSPGAPEAIYLADAEEKPPTRGFDMVRVTARGPAWDMTGWVRTGINPAPVLSVDLSNAQTVQDGRVAMMNRHYAAEDAAGIEINAPVGTWILRGEASVTDSDDKDIGTTWFYTIQAEHSYRAGLLTLVYAGRIPDNEINLSALPFDRVAMPSVTLAFTQSERWGDWRAAWVGTTDNVGGVFTGELAKPLTDAWRVTVGADIPHGATTSALGAFSFSRRVRTSLMFHW